MIILYDSTEQNFTSLGIGVLKDATDAIVIEELNGSFELEMEYPVNGNHYKDIGLQKIITAQPNAYDEPQPFRIYKITKPLNGIVLINAEHISYDMVGYTVKPFEGTTLLETLSKIQNGSIRKTPFSIFTNFDKEVSMKTKNPYNMRSILGGGGSSVVDIYGGYYKFNKFRVDLLAERGSDRGVVLRYGKNLTELDQEIDSDKMYTGIYPFYFAVVTETKTGITMHHQSVYIVEGIMPFTSGWLALSPGALSFIPMVELIPVQVKTEGGFFDNIYWYKRQLVTEVYIVGSTVLAEDWLSLTFDGDAISPVELTIYKINTEGEYQFLKYIWNGEEYVQYDGDGFYMVPETIPPPLFISNTVETVETEQYVDIATSTDVYIVSGATELTSGWLSYIFNGDPIVPEINVIYKVQTEVLDTCLLNIGIPILADHGDYVTVSIVASADAAPMINIEVSVTISYEYPFDTNVYTDTISGILIAGNSSVTLQADYPDNENGSAIYNLNTVIHYPLSFNVVATSEYKDKKYKWDDVAELYEELGPEFSGNGIIYVNEAAEFQKILTLNLTTEFQEPPTVEVLRSKALDYLENNDITVINNSTTVSFVKLADSPEYERYSVLETVELGDMVTVIYEALDVESRLQVITTEFNVITNKYNEIELGEKTKNLADNAITFGDSISALSNDAQYTEQANVKKFIAETITTDYIQAKNANLTNAQIEDLKIIKINASGIIEGSSITIDKLVANLLITENAEVRNTLTTGEITVRGKIIADSGVIGGAVIEDGLLKVSSANITGKLVIGQLPPNIALDGDIPTKVSEITNDLGYRTYSGVTSIIDGRVTTDFIEALEITVESANITGELEASQIKVEDIIITNSIRIKNIFDVDTFVVNDDGATIINKLLLNVQGASSSVGIDSNGKLIAVDATIAGSIITDEINVNKIIIDDLITLEMSSFTSTTTTTYTLSTGVPVVSDHGDYVTVAVMVSPNNVAPIDKEVSVTISYEYPFDTNVYTDTINGILIAGNSSVTLQADYPDNNEGGAIRNINVTVYYPHSFNVTTTTGETALSVDSNIVPDIDDHRDLGASDLRWDDIWATNATIQTSDKRSKKDIKYDILAYDSLFDKLRPVSYKFKNGKGLRTHLGFIAQDIEVSLNEIGMSTNDFAGLIKDLGLKGRNKETQEDVTDEDYTYGIRYSELHAMEVKQIQQLKKRVLELEKKIEGS